MFDFIKFKEYISRFDEKKEILEVYLKQYDLSKGLEHQPFFTEYIDKFEPLSCNISTDINNDNCELLVKILASSFSLKTYVEMYDTLEMIIIFRTKTDEQKRKLSDFWSFQLEVLVFDTIFEHIYHETVFRADAEKSRQIDLTRAKILYDWNTESTVFKSLYKINSLDLI